MTFREKQRFNKNKAAQSVIEYTLLLALAIIALVTVDFLGRFKTGGLFEHHFGVVRNFITERHP